MKFLLDTNVISEITRTRPDEGVLNFLHESDEDRTYLSAVTWAELQRGVALLPAGARRQRLSDWLEHDLRDRFGPRILSIDVDIAERWGVLMAASKENGRNVSVMDGFIAATALVHDLCIVTRNEKDFSELGVRLINPWASTDPDAGRA